MICQELDYICGPVALYNAGLWSGKSWKTVEDYAKLSLTKSDGIGTLPENLYTKDLSIICETSNPSEMAKYLENGCALIVLYNFYHPKKKRIDTHYVFIYPEQYQKSCKVCNFLYFIDQQDLYTHIHVDNFQQLTFVNNCLQAWVIDHP